MLTLSNFSPCVAYKRVMNLSVCKLLKTKYIISILIMSIFRNMVRNVTFWYTKELSIFENNEDLGGTKIDVTRMPAGTDNPPSLKISHNTYEQEEKADWEFMRLSLPVTCNDRFIT